MKILKNLSLFIISALLILFSCNNTNQEGTNENNESDSTELTHHAKKDCNEVHWSHHKGEEGPNNWKNLCDGFSDCGGSAQSPINIITTELNADNDMKSIEFNYSKSKIDIINNEHTVQFNISGENTTIFSGKPYKLLQFHFHSLSEHTVDGEHFPFEVHFVHKNTDTDYAVLGVMFKEGVENKLFAKYLQHFPKSKGEYKSDDVIDLLSLLPDNKAYYHYSGSLTTPPCSEVVSWYILKTPLTVSKEQIEKFSKILNNNYRPTLPINDRTVFVVE